MDKVEAARKLYREWVDTGGLYLYGKARRAGFTRRVRNLARRLDPKNPRDAQAIMYIDVLTARAGFAALMIGEWSDDADHRPG